MLKISSILICTEDSQKLKKFYSEVFQKEADDMGGWVLAGMALAILDHSEIHGKSKEGPRIMFNLETPDVKAEFERINKISGAEVIKEPYQMPEWDGWIATLADPDGNYFQLMTPWEGEK